MTTDEYRQYLAHAYLLARMAAAIPVSELLDGIARAHAVGHILDPTLYRDKSRAMDEDASVLRALAPLAALGKRFALPEGES